MRLIDADEMLVNESRAYISAQMKVDDSLTRRINEVVHMKVQKIILDTPTIETEPVRRGRWEKCDLKKLEHGFVESIPGGGICCSECRRGFSKQYMWWDYCPKCGAKMDGGENHDD